jgi:hypothetical protein
MRRTLSSFPSRRRQALFPLRVASRLPALCRRSSARCLAPHRGETAAWRSRRSRAQRRASRGHCRPGVAEDRGAKARGLRFLCSKLYRHRSSTPNPHWSPYVLLDRVLTAKDNDAITTTPSQGRRGTTTMKTPMLCYVVLRTGSACCLGTAIPRRPKGVAPSPLSTTTAPCRPRLHRFAATCCYRSGTPSPPTPQPSPCLFSTPTVSNTNSFGLAL